MHGEELSPEDVHLLLTSNGFQLSPLHLAGSFFPKGINLVGGGDPTWHSDFPGFLRAMAEHASHIHVLTGGINPELDLDRLERVLREIDDDHDCAVGFGVTAHPFGYLAGDGRVRESLLTLANLPLIHLRLNVLGIPPVTGITRTVQSRFPYLTLEEAHQSELFEWLDRKFILLRGGDSINWTRRTSECTNQLLEINPVSRILRRTGRAIDLPEILTQDRITDFDVLLFLDEVRGGILNPMRVTADGHLTACFTSKFQDPRSYEGDLRGHSVNEIVHNRLLLVSHFRSEGQAWLDSRCEIESGSICDTVCKRAREAFVSDPRRIPSHRGSGETVLPVRQRLGR